MIYCKLFLIIFDCVYTCVLKVANPKEKGNEVDDNKELILFHEGIMNNPTLSRLFPGLNREREMSAMVSALTHVVSGEVPITGDSSSSSSLVLHHQPHDDTVIVTPTMPSSSSSSTYVVATSSLKRSRENDTYTSSLFSHPPSSSPAMPTSKHHINSILYNL